MASGKEEASSSLSTHVLDTSLGTPGRGMQLHLEAQGGGKDEWTSLYHDTTNDDGRVKGFPALSPGVYRLTFEVTSYYAAMDQECFYPEVKIAFKVGEGQHYHVPLLISPFGFSTYRGS